MSSALPPAHPYIRGSKLFVWLSLSTLLALAPAGAGNATTALADSTDVLRWELVGHIADQPIAWLAVPPDGLASGVLFAAAAESKAAVLLETHTYRGTTRRSRDGGKTWDSVPDAPGRVVLPPGGAPAFALSKDGVFRSANAGATWNPVLSNAADELVFSPGFQQDGTLFLRGGDHLWGSTDQGVTWTSLDPGAGQAIVAVRLSPAFASDHTLFVGADSARPKGPVEAAGFAHNPLPTDNADSLGVLVSQDAGATWTSLSDGLQIDGSAYHQVIYIAVSPDFSADQTLYVSSLGPWQPSDASGALCACITPHVGVFRTTDGGASWDAVDLESFSTYTLGGSLIVSPALATDHTVFDSLSMRGGAPSQGGCTMFVSADAGDSWQQSNAASFGAGLCGVGIMRAAGTTILLAYQQPYYLSGGPNRNINHSLDGGATWSALMPPGDGLARGFQEDLAQRQAILPDRVLQATEKGDLWEYAAFPPCAIQPVLGFGQVWTQHPDWQDNAGCPLGPEQPVEIHAAHEKVLGQGPTDRYWSASGDGCVQVYRDFNGNLQGVPLSADASNCAGAGDATLAGSILRFANGQYWLYVADAPGHGVVVSSMRGALALTH